ncbi:TRAP transporter substrate-binding protein [Qipengyuania sp. DGS5-3]|uniref:TRAP transporter substrate-binding protein n=1 Tax=Qipengyuania sp. DGS5-3 TaxID=3349632 RepID=UPI0036D2D0EE
MAALTPACAQFGATNRLTLAHTLDEQHPVHLAMVRFREELIRLSSKSIEVEIFANAQLGTERELVELVQLGAISMTKVSSLSLENFAPDMGVYSLPYLFDDSEHQRRVVQSDIGQEILDGLSDILLKGIGHYDAGARSFYMTGGPVNTPADIRGKTLRVLPSEALVKTVETFGGAATPIAFGELYAALQQGVVDGAENNPPSVLSARHHEVSKFYSLDEHVSAPDVVVMSQSVWDNMTSEQQGWAKQAMAASESYQRELWRKASDDALAEIEASGVTINRPDKAPFRDAVAELKASYDGTRIGELAARIEAMSENA